MSGSGLKAIRDFEGFMLGTYGYPSPKHLLDSLLYSSPLMTTVSLRRETRKSGTEFMDIIKESGIPILPNTAGCITVNEAINTAFMAREIFSTNMIKLEVITDTTSMYPNPFGLVEAAKKLVEEGFFVLPYCTEDIAVALRLIDIGCRALMPWAAPIGSGQGPVNLFGLKNLRKAFPDVPMIVDAGIGAPSHALLLMEHGFNGVLVNTAVARATDPPKMAVAFAEAIRIGRSAASAGLMTPRETGVEDSLDFL